MFSPFSITPFPIYPAPFPFYMKPAASFSSVILEIAVEVTDAQVCQPLSAFFRLERKAVCSAEVPRRLWLTNVWRMSIGDVLANMCRFHDSNKMFRATLPLPFDISNTGSKRQREIGQNVFPLKSLPEKKNPWREISPSCQAKRCSEKEGLCLWWRVFSFLTSSKCLFQRLWVARWRQVRDLSFSRVSIFEGYVLL